MNTHEQYEELCALAASGQASPSELEDLRTHLDDCPDCRALAYDFTQISAQGLAEIAANRLHAEIPAGMTQRFIARARSEGIEMSRESVPLRSKTGRIRAAAIWAAAAVLLVFGSLVIARQDGLVTGSEPSAVAPLAPSPAAAPPRSPNNEDATLQQELASAGARVASMQGTIQDQRRQLEAAVKTQNELKLQFAQVQLETAKGRSEKAELEARVATLEIDLAKAKTDKSATDAVAAVEEAELRKLQGQLENQKALLEQEEDLAARGSDVRDLVVARNLHIIDVHDRDGSGKTQRAFGRIFYTEGKSLIFYAYDLSDPQKLDAKVSFYVWGERLGSEKPIESLGVLHTDDAKEGRWVLTFDDPRVLAQINSVFVTAESAKKPVKEPAGKKILFAFLGDRPNHP